MISTYQETGMQVKGKLQRETARCQQMLILAEENNNIICLNKINEKGKNVNFVASGNHSLRGACNGQNDL